MWSAPNLDIFRFYFCESEEHSWGKGPQKVQFRIKHPGDSDLPCQEQGREGCCVGLGLSHFTDEQTDSRLACDGSPAGRKKDFDSDCCPFAISHLQTQRWIPIRFNTLPSVPVTSILQEHFDLGNAGMNTQVNTFKAVRQWLCLWTEKLSTA